MDVIFTSLAVEERRDAQAFDEMEFSGLGARFVEEVKLTNNRITAHPTAWQVERGEVRRCLLPRFPYKLLYAIEPDHILIIAVAHQHRQPDYWLHRINEPSAEYGAAR